MNRRDFVNSLFKIIPTTLGFVALPNVVSAAVQEIAEVKNAFANKAGEAKSKQDGSSVTKTSDGKVYLKLVDETGHPVYSIKSTMDLKTAEKFVKNYVPGSGIFPSLSDLQVVPETIDAYEKELNGAKTVFQKNNRADRIAFYKDGKPLIDVTVRKASASDSLHVAEQIVAIEDFWQNGTLPGPDNQALYGGRLHRLTISSEDHSRTGTFEASGNHYNLTLPGFEITGDINSSAAVALLYKNSNGQVKLTADDEILKTQNISRINYEETVGNWSFVLFSKDKQILTAFRDEGKVIFKAVDAGLPAAMAAGKDYLSTQNIPGPGSDVYKTASQIVKLSPSGRVIAVGRDKNLCTIRMEDGQYVSSYTGSFELEDLAKTSEAFLTDGTKTKLSDVLANAGFYEERTADGQRKVIILQSSGSQTITLYEGEKAYPANIGSYTRNEILTHVENYMEKGMLVALPKRPAAAPAPGLDNH